MRQGALAPLCARLLRLAGWKTVLEWPPGPKAVIIFYPHTSNWDFVIGILARYALAIPVRWVGKHTLFRPPFAWLFRRLGGMPVDRRKSIGLVGQLHGEFERCGELYLAIAPEGTRGRTDHWKSGFYRLALAAKAPLGLAFIDYPSRRIGIERYLELTGSEEEDLGRIRAYYADKRGRRPGQAGEIRFIA